MFFEEFEIEGPLKLTPKKFSDERGFFMETFRADKFSETIGQNVMFVQDNHSTSKHAGTVRGLHFQTPPYAQGKLVRCIRGALIDVAVDVRKGSPTYGQHVKVELSEENAAQLWVPVGFLHGFVTLVDNTEINYKCTDYYSSKHDGSVLWSDTDLKIDWEIKRPFIVSQKDKNAIQFNAFDSPFVYRQVK